MLTSWVGGISNHLGDRASVVGIKIFISRREKSNFVFPQNFDQAFACWAIRSY